jgi:CRP-like cAMP-binding protein
VAGWFGRQLRVLRPGDVLHRRGERADALYVMLAGAIELYVPPKEASEI